MVFLLVVGPLRGGGVKPHETLGKNTFFYDFLNWPEPHETQEKLI